jgi:hypothetical protein
MLALTRVIDRLTQIEWKKKERGFSRMSMPLAMQRSIKHQAPSTVRSKLKVGKVILILDNSGSCINYARYMTKLSKSLSKWYQIEIYQDANLSFNTTIYDKKQKRFIEIDPKKAYGQLDSATIFVGDIDGMDTIVQYSKMNPRTLWINLEEREDYMKNPKGHSWVHYDYKEFKGLYAYAPSPKMLPRALEKTLRTQLI